MAHRFAVVSEWLGRSLARTRGMDEAVAWAVARVDESGGAVPVGELRARTGLSKARLAAAFREQVGLTPKRYAASSACTGRSGRCRVAG